ncbi:MAG TPA: FecR domain-containing protein, partial [Lacipirellulaceae bacterium]|nr:FecR domain-containing protein [Lacipirellulaceae bacterium]
MLDADLVFHARNPAAAERAGEPGARATLAPQAPHRGFWSGRALRWAGGLAAAAAVALVMLGRGEDAPDRTIAATLAAQRQPQPIASLTLAPGADFADRTLEAGDSFLENDVLTLTAGEAHVSMSSGADFVLKAPAQVRFVSPKHVELARGVMTAHVAEWGSGFTVDTTRMRVTDLGTRFAIAASEDDVEAHVLQGQVRVQPLGTTVDGRRSVLLSEGEALRVEDGRVGGSAGATRMNAQQARFPRPTEGFRPFKPITMFNTGAALTEGDEDPHWRITAGPVGGGFHGPQFGVVGVPDERYAPNEPARSQWISMAKDLRPGGLPNSLFTFETEFDLTGFDLETVMVAAQVLADNGVRAIRVNGQPAPMQGWDDNTFGQSFTRNRFRLIEIQDGFVPGVNRIEFDVWNGVYQLESMKSEANPMSLRVEFQAYGRLAEPPPADVAQDRSVHGFGAHDPLAAERIALKPVSLRAAAHRR